MKEPQMSSKSGGKTPHCRVCGDESSGFHYGVDSCEGCKGFFRRCITQGMNHKCANEEKCDITPFTRNSCQYCRLKKCFEVGMSREASRLGRRPKRLKEVGGEGSGARSHTGNTPIAPYPSPQDLYKLRMAELQKILQSNGTFKAELMQAFLSAAKVSFQEHSKGGAGDGPKPKGKQMDLSGNLNMSSGSPMPTTSTLSDASALDNSVGLAGGGSMSGVDSPSSLHSPGGNVDFGILESFLFEHGTPSNLSSLDASSDLPINSPINFNNMNLEQVSPFSEVNFGSPLGAPASVSSVTNGVGQEGMGQQNSLNLNATASSTLSPLQFQQSSNSCTGNGGVQVKTEIKTVVKNEPGTSYSACSYAQMETFKMEPISPEPTSSMYSMASPLACIDAGMENVDVVTILEEVKQQPSDTRRILIEQVTEAITEAHRTTTVTLRDAIAVANRRISETQKDDNDIAHDMARLKLEANTMWSMFMTNMVPDITLVVKFCKRLPGFTEIDQDDQIRLIKQGAFEVMLSRFSLLVNHEEQTMLDPTLQMRAKRCVIREMPLGSFLDEFFDIAREFNPLNLSDGEVGLFTSILIIEPGRKNLSNRKAVKKIQQLFQQALFILMKLNHADSELKFTQLMNLIPMIRRINEEHFRTISSLRMESLNPSFNFPDLHREVFDGSF